MRASVRTTKTDVRHTKGERTKSREGGCLQVKQTASVCWKDTNSVPRRFHVIFSFFFSFDQPTNQQRHRINNQKRIRTECIEEERDRESRSESSEGEKRENRETMLKALRMKLPSRLGASANVRKTSSMMLSRPNFEMTRSTTSTTTTTKLMVMLLASSSSSNSYCHAFSTNSNSNHFVTKEMTTRSLSSPFHSTTSSFSSKFWTKMTTTTVPPATTTTTARRAFTTTTEEVISNNLSPMTLHYVPVLSEAEMETIRQEQKRNRQNDQRQESSIIFLHGLLGNGRNLKTFAKQLCEQQGQQGYLFDLRGHGQSSVIDDDGDGDGDDVNVHEGETTAKMMRHSFDLCVQDIEQTIRQLPIQPNTLVGHSWGGRMALQYVATSLSLSRKEKKNTDNDDKPLTIERLWLLDTVPGQANESVEIVINAIIKLYQEQNDGKITLFKNRKDLIQLLTNDGYNLNPSTAQWLASSYDLKTGMFNGFNLSVIQDILPQFTTQDFNGYLQQILTYEYTNNDDGNDTTDTNSPLLPIQIDLVRAGKNNGWTVQTIAQLEKLAKEYGSSTSHTNLSSINQSKQSQSQFRFHVLPKSGHWVHVDDLSGLLKLFS